MKVKILGTGLYAPGSPIDNIEIKKLAGIEFDHQRTEAKLGIRKRHIAHLRNLNETTADFAEHAARAALHESGVDPDDIGLFVVGTDTPEYITPATAILLQGRIQGGERMHGAFDLSSSCSSFTSGLDVASRILATDETVRYAVVVGCYNMTRYIKPGDAFGYSIFADGAGAVVLGRSEEKDSSEYLAGQFVVDGSQWNFLGVYAGGTNRPVTHEVLEKGNYGMELLQNLPGDRNVKLWPPIARTLAEKAKVDLKDVQLFIFTQINASVIKTVMELLDQPVSKAMMVMDRYGYTGSACVPMAFHTAVQEGRVKRGDLVITIASGAGFAVAGNIFRY